ncbi:conserved hypothetical protein [Talaromyces stipitatus ATCC 10500]|uniref:Uncharacterized protein n=1 Tax=Talaromyces stipitatus (strain ATCC 10500 / CBS 375.48 / QM 6759 / NRRL 1006) TaxID=441959 RepID=B8MTZ7_TALSN|nr:uncharacterized protein TSTA_006510 [Talaromyces stipitatus ATCC 10500]EED12630.1 conserved hypothetical protein [Talaromyces stipitatus ATCC 10500]
MNLQTGKETNEGNMLQPNSNPGFIPVCEPATEFLPASAQITQVEPKFAASLFSGFAGPFTPVSFSNMTLPPGTGFSSYSSDLCPWAPRISVWNTTSQNTSTSHVDQRASSKAVELQGQCARLTAAISVEQKVVPKAPKFLGYDDADYGHGAGALEEGEVRSECDSSADHRNERDGRLTPVDVTEFAIKSGPQLSEIDTRSLTPEQVLFYFGVLSLQQTQLEPVFEYTQEANGGHWSAKLTMYRDSLKIPALKSLAAAKVEICRVALSILKARYANWNVPDEPSGNLTAFSWRWGGLLNAYAKEMKLPCPEHTKYIHQKGYRYQVDVGTVTSFGNRKFYGTEDQAIEAASHEVLYLLLIRELKELHEATIAALKPEDKRVSALPPQPDMPITASNKVLKPVHTATQTNRIPKPARLVRKRINGNVLADTASNLLPVVNPRINTDRAHDEPKRTMKWKTTPDRLTKAIAHLKTEREKYERVCNMLGLSSRLEIKENFKRESVPPSYTVWATFRSDPFLTRAGQVGIVNGHRGTEREAVEMCCRNVVDYLIDLVQDDFDLEREEQEQRWKLENFGEIRKKELGLVGVDLTR